MFEVVNIKFKNKGKVYYFDPKGLKIDAGCPVIVETAKGLEFAECTRGNHDVADNEVVKPLRPVVRIATQADIKRNEENRHQEEQAFQVCQEKIALHKLDMKLVDVEYNFERSKLLFFFTSDGRVDFRELVKDLATIFKTRIELRQIGVRDEARMLGGFGICGRPFCCSQFLDEFHPVSIKMAKTQGLSLNPAKISGSCGRLMCCLKHEQEAYEDIVKTAPKNDAFVRTPEGYGSIEGLNLLRGTARVRLVDGNELMFKQMPFEDLEVLGGKGKLAEYLAAKADGRLEEAGFPPVEIKPRKLEMPAAQEFDTSWLTIGQEQEKPEKPQHSRNRKSQRRQKSADGRENNQRSQQPSPGTQSGAEDKQRQGEHGKSRKSPRPKAQGGKNDHTDRDARRAAQGEVHEHAGEQGSGKQPSRHKPRHRKKSGGAKKEEKTQ